MARSESILSRGVWAKVPYRSELGLTLFFGMVTTLYAIARLPLDMSFDTYAFADYGDFLTIHYLVSHGKRPEVDFAYHWGLIPVLLAQIWFGLFGATPTMNEIAMVVCALLIAWAIARIAATLRLGLVGIVFLAMTMPLAFPMFTITYGIEAALIAHALAQHLNGKRASALALATAACLTKPSMGYVYGLVLLIAIVIDATRNRQHAEPSYGWIDWRQVLREITPAAVTGITLILVLTAVFGPLSVAETILPIAGMASYKTMHTGFFGTGMSFWYEPGISWQFYVFTIVGFWIAASLWLIAAGTRAGRRLLAAWRNGRAFNGEDELVLTCMILHVVFVTTFFAMPVSWRYYCYILTIGVAASSIWDAGSAAVVGLLLLMAVCGQGGEFAELASLWHTSVRSPVVAGLWAAPEEIHEWSRVQNLIGRRKALLLHIMGAGPLLFDDFKRPFTDHFYLGETSDAAIARLDGEIDRAQRLVVPNQVKYAALLVWWPELKREIDRHEQLWKGKDYTVYGPLISKAATRTAETNDRTRGNPKSSPNEGKAAIRAP